MVKSTLSKRLLTPQNFQKSCRICFTVGNLYDTKTSMYEGHTIAEVLCGMINVYNFKLTEDYPEIEDPQFICFGCIKNLISAKLFFDQCSKSRKILDKVLDDFILNQAKSVTITKPIYLYRKINTIIMQRCNLNKGLPEAIIESEKDTSTEDIDNNDEEEKGEEIIKIIQEPIKVTKPHKRHFENSRRDKKMISFHKEEIKEEDEINRITDVDIDLSDITNVGLIKKESYLVDNDKETLQGDKNEIIFINTKLEDENNSSKDSQENFGADIADSEEETYNKSSKRSKIKDRKKYHCDVCVMDFIGFRPFCRHNRDKHPKSYVCHVCKKKFPNCLQLARHRWTHFEVECDICHKKVKKTSIKGHLKTHEKGYKPTPYKNVEKLCPLCGKILSISSWKDHVDGHTKPKKYKCQLCCFASSFGPSLKRHQAVHTGEKPFLCTNCGYTCNQKVALEKHLKQHLVCETPLICQFCPETFRTYYDRRIHSLTHGYSSNPPNKTDGNTVNAPTNKTTYNGPHVRADRNNPAVPNICNICSKTFKSKSKLKEHTLVHTGERPHKCDFCSSSFKQQQQLKAHTMRMHVVNESYKPFSCEICDKGFKYRQALNAHLLIHTGEKPYKCDLCPSTFRQYPHLVTHKQRIHDDRKPFSCEFCDKAFKCALSLKEHIRTHTGETIQCDHCDKTFKQSSTKYKHMREVHNIRRSTGGAT